MFPSEILDIIRYFSFMIQGIVNINKLKNITQYTIEIIL